MALARRSGSAMNSQTSSGGTARSNVRSTRTVIRLRSWGAVKTPPLARFDLPRGRPGPPPLLDLHLVGFLGEFGKPYPHLLRGKAEVLRDVLGAEVSLACRDAFAQELEDAPFLVGEVSHPRAKVGASPY